MNFLCLLPLLCVAVANTEASAPIASASSAVALQDVDALLAKGREALDGGDAAGAQAAFDQAAELDKSSPKTRTWVIRGWIANERINDAYNATDELAKTSPGNDADYLYGCAFAADARRAIATGQTGPFTAEKINDAITYLSRVTAADPQKYRDGFLLLAWACWEQRDLEKGVVASSRAVELMPRSAEAPYQLGRFELARYQALASDEKQKDAAEAAWKRAKDALDKAAKMLEGDATPWKRSLLARVEVDRGHAQVWKKDLKSAEKAYARAMALDPTLVNFTQVLEVLGEEPFLAALEDGEQGFVATWGKDNPADATLLWWLGWARLKQKQYKEAEQAYALCVEKYPQYANSWFYIGVCRYSTRDQKGAVEALLHLLDAKSEEMTAALQQNPTFHMAVLDSLIGFCEENSRKLDAARLSESQAIARPDEPRYWNNTGYFYRDAGAQAAQSADEERRKTARDLWERAYEAYSRALELSPDDPSILNDTAVMLHYYLDRDTERAKEMYKKSNAKAQEQLARKDLSAETRQLYEIALRDSKNNLAKLERGIKTNG